MRKFESIRIIGDIILHKTPKKVDWQNAECVAQVHHDIALMKKLLEESKGVGISSNQCQPIKQPLQIILVGTDNIDARAMAKRNYPEQEVPHVTVMINPKIVKLSGEKFYPKLGESCLSVKGKIRGKVARHTQVEIEFDDETGAHHQKIFSGFIAHVIQHECDHQMGFVFVEKILSDLSATELTTLTALIEYGLAHQSNQNLTDAVGHPILAFNRTDDQAIIDPDAAKATFCNTDADVLSGLLLQIKHQLQHRSIKM